MAKKVQTKTVLTLDDFDGLDNRKSSEQMQAESLGIRAKKNGERSKKGAARGCKPGYTRHTYILPQQMIDQVKAVAQFFRCSEVSAAEQLIQKGLDEIKKENGKKALTLRKEQSLFK